MTRTPKHLVAGVALTLLVGCAHASTSSGSSHTEWSSRIGKYNYDQALDELGPPAQQRDLAGGETVCTWPRKGTGAEYRQPPTSYGTTSAEIQNDDVVILTFDSHKVLINCVTKPDQPAPK
jgi:hypothetical protein